jgi:hypothetical protein
VQYCPSSVQGVPAGSKQESVGSQQLLHSLPGQGSPEDAQVPAPSQLSVPLQYRPSSVQGVPEVSKQLSVASWQVLHSVSGQGLPAPAQLPAPSQRSGPLQ